MPAYWAIVGALSMPYWWTFIIASTRWWGAHAYPRRQPVIAYALENPLSRMVRSHAPGSEATQVCVHPS